MSLILYKTDLPYYYALEIGMPEQPVSFGEGPSPAEAVDSMVGTQYQSADFGCRAPVNSALGIYFDLGHSDPIYDCTDEEYEEAEEAFEN
jgi:hypothetical protein